MKAKKTVIGLIVFCLICPLVHADRALERDEILNVFENLIDSCQSTWIPAGSAQARHYKYRGQKIVDANELQEKISGAVEQYLNSNDQPVKDAQLRKDQLDAIPFNIRNRYANEYEMVTTDLIKTDGNRYYRQIDIESREDLVKPESGLRGNQMTDQFDLQGNKTRIFAWDGELYTQYIPSVNYAITRTAKFMPSAVRGFLTTGRISWGTGLLTYENLAAADFYGAEKIVDGQRYLEIFVNNLNMNVNFFISVLPDKNYALHSFRYTPGSTVVIKQYSGYELIEGNYVPSEISIEKFNVADSRLLARDLWQLQHIDTTVPNSYEFNLSYEEGDQVEFFSGVDSKSQLYEYSSKIDTEQILVERLVFLDQQDANMATNCATAALSYAAGKLGKKINQLDLAELVNESGQTSLYDLRKSAENSGLHVRVVKTDIKTIKTLENCQIILHIPGKNHFVVVDHIDDQYIWNIDMASRRFLYKSDISFFDMAWPDGIALLISDQPITENFNEISQNEQMSIKGSGGYSCSKVIQESGVIFCSQAGTLCTDMYVEILMRLGCETAESGECYSSVFLRKAEDYCIENIFNYGACTTIDEWQYYYIRACM